MKRLAGAFALMFGLAAPFPWQTQALASVFERPETYKIPSPVLGVYAVGRQPMDLAFSPSGEAWVVNMRDNTVSRLSPEGHCLGVYPVEARPKRIVFDHQGNAWVVCTKEGTLVKLAPDGRRLATVPRHAFIADLAIDQDDALWVSEFDHDRLVKLSPAGEPLGSAEVPRPGRLAVDRTGDVWVCGMTLGEPYNLLRLSPAVDVVGGYRLPNVPMSVTIGPDERVWLTFLGFQPHMARLSRDRRLVEDLWPGFFCKEVETTASGDALWVTNSKYLIDVDEGGMRPSLIDPLTNTVCKLSPGGRVLATYSAGSDAWCVKVSPQGDLWVVNTLSGRVSRLRP